MPEALLAEDFKSYKTLKQESAPQETTKEILAKSMEEKQSTKFPRAMPLSSIGQKMRSTEAS